MSSNHFLNSQPFESRWTCFLTSTGRILDVALVLVLKDSILVVSSIEKKQMLWEHFDKHIFPMDNVSVTEENYASFVWIGKQAVDWIQNWYQQLGMNGDQEQFQVFDHTNHPIYLLQQSTLEPKWKGYLLLCSAEDIHKVHASMSSFQKKGFLLFHMDKEHWECLRIEMGKGNVLCEWSEQYHPLEAGLWHMVSFQKGCYLGQETILRLKTYGGVKRYLVGWFLEYPVETPSHVYCQKRRVGNITSCKTIQKTTTRESQPQDMTVVIGLGYLQSEYATLEYEMDKPLERIASIQDLPWESTIFFSKVPGQTSTPVKCIVRRIVFPVWH
ncbi:aminomethyltransferase [Galdieria sulphuraria]|uniref:Aminomethyltransferase n=1 Tax=Galdieria sulphuraria TaxID=130081 RepID=M2WRD2_GALSU|nr:aminomethyltransferase [Galdieria sulphuraria]EME26350.1 aminomethyltransferase [Galdieria sulphuraria]|eukprot:XP_005702870.1 aminomethyltransferase [Galdieria sulphuraria]